MCVCMCESKTRGGSISHFCSFNFVVADNRINLSEIGNLRLLNRNTLECCPFLNLFSALKTEVRFLTSKREELTIRLIAIQWNFWFLCESTRLLDAMIQTTIHLYCWYLIRHSYHHQFRQLEYPSRSITWFCICHDHSSFFLSLNRMNGEEVSNV